MYQKITDLKIALDSTSEYQMNMKSLLIKDTANILSLFSFTCGKIISYKFHEM